MGVWGRGVLDGERGVKQGVCFQTAFSTRKDLCSAKGVGEGVTKVLFSPTLVHVLSQPSLFLPPIATNRCFYEVPMGGDAPQELQYG